MIKDKMLYVFRTNPTYSEGYVAIGLTPEYQDDTGVTWGTRTIYPYRTGCTDIPEGVWTAASMWRDGFISDDELIDVIKSAGGKLVDSFKGVTEYALKEEE